VKTCETRPVHILVPVKYPVGGIRTYLKYTYGKLDNKKYRFFLASQDTKWLKIIKEDLPDHQVEIVPTRFANQSLALAYAVGRALVGSKIDIIHSQGYTAGIITCLLNLFFRKPHIVTLHHVFRAGQFSDSFWDTLPRAKRFFIETVLKTASRIQPVSNDARENLLTNFPGLKSVDRRIVAIPNGIDVERFIQNTPEGHPDLPENTFLIGYLGRFMPEKGFQYVIDVAQSLVNNHKVNDFKVVAIGGFGGFVREYRKEIAKRNLTDHFLFLGFTKNVYNTLKHLHVILIPSLGEACPLVPMEALIAGTPVIGFSCIGLREVLSNTPGIMVPVKDVRGMTNEVLRIKGDYEKIKNVFDGFVAEATKRFDSSNSAKQLEQLYNDVLH